MAHASIIDVIRDTADMCLQSDWYKSYGVSVICRIQWLMDAAQPNSLPEIVMPASLITGDSDAAIPSIDIRDTADRYEPVVIDSDATISSRLEAAVSAISAKL